MKFLILLLITIGVALDTYALMVTQGALIPLIKFKTVISYMGIFSFWQIIAVFAGYYLGNYPIAVFFEKTLNENYILTAVLILILGVLVIFKAFDKKNFLERRMDLIDFRKINYLAVITSLDSFLVSFSLTISSIELTKLVILALLNANISIVLGIYTGYNYGYEVRTKLRYISAAVLIISGIGIIL